MSLMVFTISSTKKIGVLREQNKCPREVSTHLFAHLHSKFTVQSPSNSNSLDKNLQRLGYGTMANKTKQNKTKKKKKKELMRLKVNPPRLRRNKGKIT